MKSNTPTFSILLPTHNRGDVVASAIDTVLHQTYSSFELLVVGDGCTDNTESVVKRFVASDTRVRWFPFQKGKGFGYEHRNTVLKKTSGKYVAFAAHDDLWFPDHLEIFLNFFSKNPNYEIAFSRPLWVHPDGTIVPSAFNILSTKISHIFFKKHNEFPAVSCVHSRKMLEEVSFWNAKLPIAADWDLWKRIIKKDPQHLFGFISQPTTLHFRAQWRTEKNSWNPHCNSIYDHIQRSAILKSIWQVSNSRKTVIQKVMLKMLGNKNWIHKIREECPILIDELTYSSTTALDENIQLRSDLQRITSTRGYMLMEKLRKLKG